MSPDRHDRVSELYHEASGRPPEKREAFLTEACGDDVALRAEVESLLRFEGAASPFLEKPAAAFAARTEMRNRRLGPYTIIAPLGAGGMGEVYRARDSKLGRDVAIKILPSYFTSDPERRSRFAREARLLATLNHPHIGAIYGLEEADGVTALVLELVEGPTLADSLERGPLPIAEALTIARQLDRPVSVATEIIVRFVFGVVVGFFLVAALNTSRVPGFAFYVWGVPLVLGIIFMSSDRPVIRGLEI